MLVFPVNLNIQNNSMTVKLIAFLALSLFILFSAKFVKGAENILDLRVNVATNIHSYFDGKDFIAKTNTTENIIITRTDTSITIVPAL